MSGFDGREFLTQAEWETYLRRMPVRYIKKKHAEVCEVCGLPASKDNPLQHSHRIGFNVGVRHFALTPDFLDSHTNIKSAHRKVCNAAVELGRNEILSFLESEGLSVPEFVHQTV